jgi:phenylalanyl-tRNA synthetase beta chain
VHVPTFSKKSHFHLPSVDNFAVDNHQRPIAVEVENTEACPRYAGVTISGVRIAPSPDWLQNRLRAIGLTPINNVVDVTNFILHEMAQPLHAFDADKITGNKVVVKTLPAGTSFVSLDGVERKLADSDLMICNTQEGMCIGGVFGGLESGISEQTTNIFLESAYFNPVYIRRTAKRHGLNTDASFRFERGIDPLNTVYALKRAAMLIKEVAGGAISSEIVDVHPTPAQPFTVQLNYQRINGLVGKEIDADTIQKILEALEIQVDKRTPEGLEVKIPPYRVDVQREADVVEDILRIYGYNNVEFSDELRATLSYTQKPEREKVVNAISDFLSSCGFHEILSNSLSKTAYYEESEVFKAENTVKILNPLSQDLGCMRQSLLYGGLEAVIYNINHRNPDLKLFEFGNCYVKEERTGQALQGFTERQHLALFITGSKNTANWNTSGQPADFYTLKGYAINILNRLGIAIRSLTVKEADSNELFSEALVYAADKTTTVLEIATIHPKLLKRFDIKTPVYYADFRWDVVTQLLNRVKISYKEIPRFPEVIRDLSLLVDKQVKFAEIARAANIAEPKLLKDVSLFDVYESDKIANGKKSYAVRFTLQDIQQTLTDQQIDKAMQHIAGTLEKETGALVRQ